MSTSLAVTESRTFLFHPGQNLICWEGNVLSRLSVGILFPWPQPPFQNSELGLGTIMRHFRATFPAACRFIYFLCVDEKYQTFGQVLASIVLKNGSFVN